MRHMMIDIETLSTASNAAIIQLGAVVFETASMDDPRVAEFPEFQQWNVSVDSCLELGGRVDGSTLDWWLGQSDAARRSVTATPKVSIGIVLSALSVIYSRSGAQRVWSHGASFDVPILDHYYRAAGQRTPWNFWDIRDTRTLYEAAEGLGWVREKRDTAHTAMADAMAQAGDVLSAMRFMRPPAKKD